jgi:hypothetical protein
MHCVAFSSPSQHLMLYAFRAGCTVLQPPPLPRRALMCRLLLISLIAACASFDAWPVECGSDDCSRYVAVNISLVEPYIVRRFQVVRSSMPLAYSVVTDSIGRAFVGSLDGSFTCLSLDTGAVQWSVSLGFGPLSSSASMYAHPRVHSFFSPVLQL